MELGLSSTASVGALDPNDMTLGISGQSFSASIGSVSVVDMHFSPLASIPIWPPRHAPQVGVLIAAPALENILNSPSSID